MSVIKIQVVDQSLIYTNTPVIASGATNEDGVQFDFDSTWDGYSKVAVFYRQKGAVYYSLVDEDDTAAIPREVMAASGTVCLGVMGVKGNATRTSEVLRYRIANGSLDDITFEEPTDDIYQQLLTTWTEIKNECQDTKDAQAAFIAKMTTDVATAITNTNTATDACYAAIGALQLQWSDFNGAYPGSEPGEDDEDMDGGYPSESGV